MVFKKKRYSHLTRKQLNVLFITMYLYGYKTYTDEIVTRLRRNQSLNVKLIVLNSRFTSLGPILFHFRNIFRQYWKYDIIISNHFVTPYLFSSRKIQVFHQSYYETMKSSGFTLTYSIGYILQVLSSLGAKRVIVPSTATKNTASRLVNQNKIFVIPNGIRIHSSKRSKSREIAQILGKEKIDGSFILSVGRFAPHKGHERTLISFIKSKIMANLIFVGFEDQIFVDSILDRYPHYRNRIYVLGKVSDEILQKLYSSVDIYIALPYMEGFGLTFLEAMSHGVPVIAPKIPPFIENIGNCGILVENVNDAAEALKKLNSDKKFWKEMSILGKKRSADFNWDKSVEGFLRVIKSML